MLRQLGIITEKDIYGSMEWRYRLRQAGSTEDSSSNDSVRGFEADVGEEPPMLHDNAANDRLTPFTRADASTDAVGEMATGGTFGASVKGGKTASTPLPVIGATPFTISFSDNPVFVQAKGAKILPCSSLMLRGHHRQDDESPIMN